MKKIPALLSVFIFYFTVSFLTVTKAHAQPLCPPGFSNLCNLNQGSIGGIAGTIITVLIILAILFSLFFLIWGGIRWISSGGDKGKVDQARNTLIAAIVGLIISLVAFFIVNTVLSFFTGQGMSQLSIPTLLQK